MYVCVYVYIYIYTYICIHVHIYMYIIIIFLHGLGRLTCPGIDVLPLFPRAYTISFLLEVCS